MTYLSGAHVLFVPVAEHPRVVSADGTALQSPSRGVGGVTEAVQVPPARLHPLVGHRWPRSPRQIPDKDSGPPV